MRTMTFRDRKIIAGSTPVFDYGPATRLYDKSDKRIYECLCPSCNEYSEIHWKDIRWNEGDPDSAHWVCPNIEELDREIQADRRREAEMGLTFQSEQKGIQP